MSQTLPTEPELPASEPPPARPDGAMSQITRFRKHPVVDLLLTLIVAVIVAYGVLNYRYVDISRI